MGSQLKLCDVNVISSILNCYLHQEHEEFNALYNGLKADSKNNTGKNSLSPSNVKIPDAVDWRDNGYVSPVKSQVRSSNAN